MSESGVSPSGAQRFEAAVAAAIGMQRYELWFRAHVLFRITDADILLTARSAHLLDWLTNTFADDLARVAAETFGKPIPVRYEVNPAAFATETATEPADKLPPGPQSNLFGETIHPPAVPKKPRSTEPKPGRRFRSLTDFVVGNCNRVAHAAAQTVVDEQHPTANPLVLYGPVGVGKSHLLEGIYLGLRKAHPEAKPCFVTAEDFTSRAVQAMRFGKMTAFRTRFREPAALIVDDLHFLAKKTATQEEFLHTFDALIADGKPVVVSIDCHPRLADELMPELVDRLLGGSVCSLMPPDDETRLALLKAKANAVGPFAFPGDVIAFLAKHLRGNVRELEGAITAIRHYARVSNRPIDAGLVRDAVGDLLRHAVRGVSLADVDAAVCRTLHLPAGTLQSSSKAWNVTHPRMAAIYLARKHTAATFGEIAKHFGIKQHSSAVAAEKRVRKWLANNERVNVGESDWPADDLLARIERELGR